MADTSIHLPFKACSTIRETETKSRPSWFAEFAWEILVHSTKLQFFDLSHFTVAVKHGWPTVCHGRFCLYSSSRYINVYIQISHDYVTQANNKFHQVKYHPEWKPPIITALFIFRLLEHSVSVDIRDWLKHASYRARATTAGHSWSNIITTTEQDTHIS